MSSDTQAAGECTPLLHDPRLSTLQHEQDLETASSISSTVSKDEQLLVDSTVGERLPYNDYTTIDWLHDLVKDSFRYRHISSLPGLRYRILGLFDACSGWIAVVIIGALTAVIAFVVDIAVATVADWKVGYCSSNPWKSRENCCRQSVALVANSTTRILAGGDNAEGHCAEWHAWTDDYARGFAIYVALALVFGTISSSATMLTRSQLPSTEDLEEEQPSSTTTKSNKFHASTGVRISTPATRSNQRGGKVMYNASGSGIPEIKCILSGFNIPSFLSFRVLVVKAFGAVFAVSTGMCLGKEGPFVHISTCVGYLVGMCFPKYKDNGRKMRELLSAACSSGLSVAFGAPIGGVLFSYEEISTYFPRKVLWRAFLCSLTAAIVLKQLNPTGTGKLVLFETNYGTDYDPIHYLVFILLGISGGIFGGLFCKLNFAWSKYFRRLPLIKNNPVLEVILVVLATTLLQFPNPLLRDPGDMILKSLLIDCKSPSSHSLICAHESSSPSTNWSYIALLTHGTLTKLALTILTFGIKVPSGIIIPALDAGALFGRLTGYLLPNTSSPNPGIFALVGAAAFLAGTTRMTISLAVIMFELTGQLDYVVPHMVAILVAKWTADAVSEESVYDIAQTVLGHPFLDAETALRRVRGRGVRVGVLVPTRETMRDITVVIPISASAVPYSVLKGKLDKLRARGLMDAGLVLVQSPSPSITPVLRGYISQAELAFGLESCLAPEEDTPIHLLPPFTSDHAVSSSNDPLPTDHVVSTDLSPLVDRTPLSLHVDAPLEYAVEMFGKLGVRYLIISGEVGSGEMGVIGVVVKKRMVGVLEGLS